MKILHTADWHLGASLNNAKRYHEFNAMLDFQPENRPEYGDIQALISVVIAGKRRVLQKQKNIKENNDL